MLDRDGLEALCRARARLRAAGEEPLRIRRLAAESGLSPHHFIRRFKAVFGDTPHQVAVRARLDRAKALLLDSKDSVTDISLRLGFSSLGTFSARFAREVGMSPSRFRRLAVRPCPEATSCLGLMTGEPLPLESNFEEAPERRPGDTGRSAHRRASCESS
jgi:AraC-like DNA-binding protein